MLCQFRKGVQFDSLVNENYDRQKQPRQGEKKKKGKRANTPSLPQSRLRVFFPIESMEGLAPNLGRAPLPYQQSCWSSFPWEPGSPGHPGLRHVEEGGGRKAPERSSESSLFSKLFPKKVSLTPWCQILLQ